MIRSAVRRLLPLLSFVALFGAVAVLTAGPAAADTPENWPVPDEVSLFNAFLLLIGIPILVFVVIALLVYAPSLARGEGLTATSEPESQWLGGPRKSPEELAQPDGEGSQAGGAGGSW